MHRLSITLQVEIESYVYLKVWVFWWIHVSKDSSFVFAFFNGCFVFAQMSRDTLCKKTPKQLSDQQTVALEKKFLHFDDHS